MGQSLVGTIQTLFVEQKSKTGYILSHGTESIFLHQNETEHDFDIGDYIKVFLSTDRDGKLIATTSIPDITRETFGWANVVKVVANLGVFVSIGDSVEVLVSKDDLPLYTRVWPNENDKLYVTLGQDRRGRLLAIPATERNIESLLNFADPEQVNLNDTVNGTVYFTSKEGSVLLTEESYRGFIHHTEREKEPRLGEHVTGRVIEVKDDGTINVSLLPLKHERIDDDAEKILSYLTRNDGMMSLNDRSNPEDIRDIFNMSKSAFKRALGRLMREKKIDQNESGTFIIDEDSK